MKKLNLLLLTLTLCFTPWFQGCDNSSATASSGAKKLRLAFVGNNSSDFWSIVQLGSDFAARQLGDVDVIFRFPANRTAAAQQELVSDLVADGVDGVAISPIDADSQTEFLNGIAAKTLLVCADSDAASSKRVFYVGADNVASGKQAAELLKAALPQGGKVALLVGYPKAQNTQDRLQGLQAGLAGSNIEIIDTLVDGGKSAVAQKNAEDALAQHPDLAGLVGIYGYHGPALLTAVHSAGKAGIVKLVCFEDESDTLAGIIAGDIYGTVAQKPLQLGWQTIVHMAQYLHGDKSQADGGKVLLRARVITKADVKDYIALQKASLLHPQADQP